MPDTHVVILAAGRGTRMKSGVPKVLHRAAGLTLIERVLRTADAVEPIKSVLVVGHQADEVQSALSRRPNLRFALQSPQLGTGHALLQAEPELAGAAGTLVCSQATFHSCGPKRSSGSCTRTTSGRRRRRS
jgi:bifunctional UDP-N-acetylglucosamine pyrophosphorylase/glucosamine-1-phosphate N-acetyltransferase